MVVGILALQGAVREHQQILVSLGASPVLVKTPAALKSIDALIIPGGESTTIGKLMVASGLFEAVRREARAGLPVFGTCAGLILMSRESESGVEPRLGLLDVAITRNAYGRQVDSFEAEVEAHLVGRTTSLRGVFIRAPVIKTVGPGVTVLAAVGGTPVLVEDGPFLGCSFHPELAGEAAVHRYFLQRLDSLDSTRTESLQLKSQQKLA